MALSSLANKALFDANGVATSWPFGFPILDSNDLSLILTDASGVETVLSPSVYGVAGIGSPSGGSVAYPLSGSPLAAPNKLTILRTVPFSQTTVLSNQGGYYPEVLEQRLDQIYMGLQQMAETVTRSCVAPVHDAARSLVLPEIARRANRIPAFDGQGNVTVSNVDLATIEAPGSAAAASAASAAAAAVSAAQAASMAAGLSGTSTSSVTVGTGSRSFITQAGKQFVATEFVAIVRTSAPTTTYMQGQVTAYDSATGALTVNVATAAGSGSYSDWTISPSGPAALPSGITVQTVYVPAEGMRPRLTNGCATLQIDTGASGQPDIGYLGFNAATEQYAEFSVRLPKSWNQGAIDAELYFTKSGTGTGDVMWGAQAVYVPDTAAFAASFGTAAETTKAVSASTKVLHKATTVTLTPGGTLGNAGVTYFRLYRKAAAGGDTFASDAWLLGVALKYTTSVADDT